MWWQVESEETPKLYGTSVFRNKYISILRFTAELVFVVRSTSGAALYNDEQKRRTNSYSILRLCGEFRTSRVLSNTLVCELKVLWTNSEYANRKSMYISIKHITYYGRHGLLCMALFHRKHSVRLGNFLSQLHDIDKVLYLLSLHFWK